LGNRDWRESEECCLNLAFAPKARKERIMVKSLRIGVWIATGALILFAVASFINYTPAIDAARRVGFSDDVIKKGLVRSAESRMIFWGAQFAQVTLFCWAGLSGVGRQLAEYWLVRSKNRMWLAAILTVVTFAIAREMLLLPFNVLSYFQGLRWELLSENYTLVSWGKDYLVTSSIEGLFLLLAVVFFWILVKKLPRLWWCVAPLGGGVFAILYALLAPLILDPLMNRFVPLEETQWKALKPQLMELVEKADLPVREILVMDASKRSSHSNAYFTGFGATRRIVLYDNLLRQLSGAEVEAVLAHEIGHWENDHIVFGILLGTLGMWLGCWLIDGILIASLRQEPWRAQYKHDARLMGWIMLLLFWGQWMVRPLEHQISRHFECQADLRALELIEDRQFAIECEKRMAIENIANVAPSPWNSWMFSSHPSSVQRIETAKSWKP
jgi:STE24 endopeptidase